MKALILDNKVVDIVEAEFEVHNSMTFMDCSDDCETGWSKINGVLTAPLEPPEPTYEFKRMQEYPPIGDQLDMIYKDMKNSTTTHADAVEAVKTKWPKDNSGPVE